MTILIDGYNVLHSIPQFAQELKHGLKHARKFLIRKVADFSDFHGCSAWVIFDAQHTDQHKPNVMRKHGIRVVYTQADQIADAYIVKWIQKHRHDHDIEVVTSDAELIDRVRRLGASYRTTIEFSDTFSRTSKIIVEQSGGLGSAIPDSDLTLGDLLPKSEREKWRKLKSKLKSQ